MIMPQPHGQCRIIQNQSPKFDYNNQGIGPKIRQYEHDVEEIDNKQGTIPKTRYDDHEIGLSHKQIERDESLNNFTNKVEIEQDNLALKTYVST